MRLVCLGLGVCVDLGSAFVSTQEAVASGHGVLAGAIGALSLCPLVFVVVQRMICLDELPVA